MSTLWKKTSKEMTMETMVVCLHCLKAIESREGDQEAEQVFFSEDEHRKCDWCGDEIEEGWEFYPC